MIAATEVTDIMKRAWLRDVPLFSDLADNDVFISALANALEKRSAGPKELLIEKGEIGVEMYFIVRGEAEVLDSLEKGAQPLATLSSKIGGDLTSCYFGEEALLGEDGAKRSAYVHNLPHHTLISKDVSERDCLWWLQW